MNNKNSNNSLSILEDMRELVVDCMSKITRVDAEHTILSTHLDDLIKVTGATLTILNEIKRALKIKREDIINEYRQSREREDTVVSGASEEGHESSSCLQAGDGGEGDRVTPDKSDKPKTRKSRKGTKVGNKQVDNESHETGKANRKKEKSGDNKENKACPEHPNYGGMRTPRPRPNLPKGCPKCWGIYNDLREKK